MYMDGIIEGLFTSAQNQQREGWRSALFNLYLVVEYLVKRHEYNIGDEWRKKNPDQILEQLDVTSLDVYIDWKKFYAAASQESSTWTGLQYKFDITNVPEADWQHLADAAATYLNFTKPNVKQIHLDVDDFRELDKQAFEEPNGRNKSGKKKTHDRPIRFIAKRHASVGSPLSPMTQKHIDKGTTAKHSIDEETKQTIETTASLDSKVGKGADTPIPSIIPQAMPSISIQCEPSTQDIAGRNDTPEDDHPISTASENACTDDDAMLSISCSNSTFPPIAPAVALSLPEADSLIGDIQVPHEDGIDSDDSLPLINVDIVWKISPSQKKETTRISKEQFRGESVNRKMGSPA
ncbi:hypothetical protein PAXRUDRAFT_21590 [Paxillus rubicundulus Ve08.2h10]|uniref:Uncharacterized protein n=1 Tax=Paxillus rubicundulus Ve08.2h10 TaxID=930991 RepID=A0A0D0D768_9AGAM|nr:hypothetical protein PAXRUDRAFT_21590 [Paxillus rubicundulus Ve08.2h10]